VAPTDNRASITGMTIVRIANGQIAEAWNVFDMLDLHQQLGTVSQLQPN
jgi:predicted ester cyclase